MMFMTFMRNWAVALIRPQIGDSGLRSPSPLSLRHSGHSCSGGLATIVAGFASVAAIFFADGAVAAHEPGRLQVAAPAIAHPREHLGYEPGADFRLTNWSTVSGYFRKLDSQSDRVEVRSIGKTSQGRDMLLAILAAPETVANLAQVQQDQKSLADPRLVADRPTEERLIAGSKPVVIITGTIHSSETAATFMLMELAWELATGREAWAREVLEKVVVLIVPSVNPDGIDIVADWYARSLGKPWEGKGLPRLYHPYAGHDTNRDFYALNLPETVNLSKVMYEEWFPTVAWDVHQMGSEGARLFVPPFFDPTNPNVDPRITQSILLIGAHMAADLAASGKKGVLHSAMYDNWWNGGNRTTPQRHNMVAILTEAASVRLASPIFLAPTDLRGKTRGFENHQPAVNFPDPWPGGWWRLRDIVEYELIAARSLLTLVARYGKSFQSNYLAMGRDQLARGETEAPYGWLVPLDQHDPAAARRMLETLAKTGIEVHRTTKDVSLYGTTYAAGSWYLPARQPYRAHLKDMMERQKYPNRFTAGGQAEPPYDVAGWTMPLLMGVKTVEIQEPRTIESRKITDWQRPRMTMEGDMTKAKALVVENRSSDDLTLIQALVGAGVPVRFHTRPFEMPGRTIAAGFAEIEANDTSRRTIDTLADRIGSHVIASEKSPASAGASYDLKNQRIALFQPWEPSMNEGWTRLVLERLGIPYVTVHRDDILAGRLHDRFDCLVFPSISPRSLKMGYRPGETEPAYVGGLEGSKDLLKEFVSSGGTIVAIENSCEYVIDELGLPVANAVGSLPSKDFYGPGSILAAVGEKEHPLTLGMPEKFSVYFDRSLGLKSAGKPGNESGTKFETVVRYGPDASALLESGWLLGPDKLSGLTAVGECAVGQGRVVLFAFPAQNRAQTAGTFRLLVNALWRGGMRKIEPGKTANGDTPREGSPFPAGAVGLVK
ncbi:peptidase M14 [bacterium]|nr:peptidase M14 [bacterium]